LRFALGELSALPRAAVVIEDRYSQVFKLDYVRPAVVADGLAELQVRWPEIPIVFCETRPLAEEWTYRYLAAAHTWADGEQAGIERISASAEGTPLLHVVDRQPPSVGSAEEDPSPRELRSRAVANGLPVSDRGRQAGDPRSLAWDAGMTRLEVGFMVTAALTLAATPVLRPPG